MFNVHVYPCPSILPFSHLDTIYNSCTKPKSSKLELVKGINAVYNKLFRFYFTFLIIYIPMHNLCQFSLRPSKLQLNLKEYFSFKLAL